MRDFEVRWVVCTRYSEQRCQILTENKGSMRRNSVFSDDVHVNIDAYWRKMHLYFLQNATLFTVISSEMTFFFIELSLTSKSRSKQKSVIS